MSTVIQNVTRNKVIRDGGGLTARRIVTPVVANRVIRDGLGAQGNPGRDGGLTFSIVTGDTAMVANTEYLTNAAGHRVAFTLPTAVAGQKNNIYGRSAGGWSITIGVGQFVEYNGNEYDHTTVIQSAEQYGNIELVCIEDNVRFLILAANSYQTIP